MAALVREGKKMCCKSKIGKFEMIAKKVVYERLAELAVFFNIEVWTNFRCCDVEKMENLQGKLLKGLYDLPKSILYWGDLHQICTCPVRYHFQPYLELRWIIMSGEYSNKIVPIL